MRPFALFAPLATSPSMNLVTGYPPPPPFPLSDLSFPNLPFLQLPVRHLFYFSPFYLLSIFRVWTVYIERIIKPNSTVMAPPPGPPRAAHPSLVSSLPHSAIQWPTPFCAFTVAAALAQLCVEPTMLDAAARTITTVTSPNSLPKFATGRLATRKFMAIFFIAEPRSTGEKWSCLLRVGQ